MTAERLPVAVIEPVGGHGGMEAYDRGLLAGLQSAGADPVLYTSAARPCEELTIERTFAGVYGRAPMAWRALRLLRAFRRTLSDCDRRGTAIAHLHFFGASTLERLSARLVRRRGLRLVATAHDVQSLAARQQERAGRALYRQVDRVIVHNRASREEVSGLVPGLPAEVIPHGNYLHDLGTPIERQAARRLLDLPVEGPIALFFGQLKRAKGLDLLLEGMARVVSDEPSVRLVVAGRAWKDDPERYRRLISTLGLSAHVDLRHGYVPDALVPAYFAAADLVVLPYRRVYQSGVLLLAMSHRRAVLVADLPAMLETVEDGISGFTFRHDDPGDLASRVQSLLPDTNRLESVAVRGYEQVRRDNDWSDIGRLTLAAYRRALGISEDPPTA